MFTIYQLLATMGCIFIVGMIFGHILTEIVMERQFKRLELERRVKEIIQ